MQCLRSLLACLLLATLAMAQPEKPVHYGVLLYPTFQLLDVFGPVDSLFLLSWQQSPMKLSMISNDTLDPVSNDFKYMQMGQNDHTFGTQIIPQYTLATAPDDIDVLIVPGGLGWLATNETQPYVDFIRERYPRLKYLMSVCTGASLLARAGVLDGRKATTNKRSFDKVAAGGPKTQWMRRARWVQDGNIWTTSGVTAGIDGTLALVEYLYGKEIADGIAKGIEHVRTTDPNNDPFAV